MKFANEELRNKLAAEYVLGTMSAHARRRFGICLKENPALRRAVTEWEKRLTPLALVLPEVEPPSRVWQAIESGIRPGRQTRLGFWESLSFWRFSSIASGLLALALLILVAVPGPESPPADGTRMVVVMNDLKTSNPAMAVSWVPGKPGKRVMRIRVIGHADMAPGTAWELWMLPGEDQKPVSLGLITTHDAQTVVVPESLAAKLDQALGLAMSVEPAGGSPTGLPTGPVLYAGQCVKT
ncbi:MAG TPA: anti-sigma factor [Burkholderiales bacterium]|jgi:anti-sigma-K factor RskA|nr:anti-sigma factor [Burkholderiales bacterium]